VRQVLEQVVPIPLWSICFMRLRAGWWVCLHTHLVTEYILPFVVAASPAVLWVAQRWLGLTLAA
jgi:hypothetical protein